MKALTAGTVPARRHAVVGHFDAEQPHVLLSSMAALFSGAWKKRFRTARWRGVPFYTEESGAQFGRRIQLFEYAQRDVPYAEDLGRSARQFQLRGYLVGGDYMGARDKLRAACEAPGPGQLVHPYLGTFTVVCTSVRIRETEQQGGFCVLDFTFSEAGSVSEPFAAVLVGSLLAAAGGTLGTAAVGAFGQNFTTQGFAPWVARAALGNLGQLSGVVGTLRGLGGLGAPSVTGAVPPPLLFGAPLSATRTVPTLDAIDEDDLADPATVGQLVLDAIGVLATAPVPETALFLLEQLFTYTVAPQPTPLPPVTPNRVQEQENAAALARLVHQAAMAAIPGPLATIAPTTYAAVASYRTELLAAVDSLELEAVSDDVYLALQAVGAAISAQLTAFGASLQPLMPYTTALPRAALVLAQRYYQDVTRADEIVTLTHAAHPGFLPTSGLIAST